MVNFVGLNGSSQGKLTFHVAIFLLKILLHILWVNIRILFCEMYLLSIRILVIGYHRVRYFLLFYAAIFHLSDSRVDDSVASVGDFR